MVEQSKTLILQKQGLKLTIEKGKKRREGRKDRRVGNRGGCWPWREEIEEEGRKKRIEGGKQRALPERHPS